MKIRDAIKQLKNAKRALGGDAEVGCLVYTDCGEYDGEVHDLRFRFGSAIDTLWNRLDDEDEHPF